jgi:hypothetical protein
MNVPGRNKVVRRAMILRAVLSCLLVSASSLESLAILMFRLLSFWVMRLNSYNKVNVSHRKHRNGMKEAPAHNVLLHLHALVNAGKHVPVLEVDEQELDAVAQALSISGLG